MISNETVANTPEPDLLALGLAYEKLQRGIFSDAIDELLTLEKAGSTFAALYLGTIYLNGNGVTVDVEKAETYFRKAAERKNVSAQYNLAVVLNQTDRQKEAMSGTCLRRNLDMLRLCLDSISHMIRQTRVQSAGVLHSLIWKNLHHWATCLQGRRC